jgi:hypothetical protein
MYAYEAQPMPKSMVLLRIVYDAIEVGLGRSQSSSSSANVKSETVDTLCLKTMGQHVGGGGTGDISLRDRLLVGNR